MNYIAEIGEVVDVMDEELESDTMVGDRDLAELRYSRRGATNSIRGVFFLS